MYVFKKLVKYFFYCILYKKMKDSNLVIVNEFLFWDLFDFL